MPERLAGALARLLALPPTVLPLHGPGARATAFTSPALADGLARLGYPGLAYRRRSGPTRNPAALLLSALSLDDLEARLVEALPWLLLAFEGFEADALVARAKASDLQNRLGFTVALAREVAERNPRYRNRASELRALEGALERSRLAREDTFCHREESERMRSWLRDHRSDAARHWNILTDLRVESLDYSRYAPTSAAIAARRSSASSGRRLLT